MKSVLVPPVPPRIRITIPRDRREVSLTFLRGGGVLRLYSPPPVRTAATVLSDDDHARIARRHGGTPITYIANDGKARAAIRIYSKDGKEGEILIDYRSELTYLSACLGDYLRIPPSARH